jgi:hypothetical protein
MSPKSDPKDVEVQVQSLKTNERTHFKVAETSTVDQVWTIASDSDHLDEPRAAGDTFRCKDGTDLTTRLDATLAQLFDENVCRGRQFEVRGPSGGA